MTLLQLHNFEKNCPTADINDITIIFYNSFNSLKLALSQMSDLYLTVVINGPVVLS